MNRRRGARVWLAVLLAGASCAGSGDASAVGSSTSSSSTSAHAGPSTTAGTAPATTVVLAPVERRVLLGAYVEPRGELGDDARRAAVLDHEAAIGRPLGLVNEFFAFDRPWALPRLRWHLDSGRALMVSWNGAPAEEILSGRADALIRERARWVLELEQTVLLRFFWEPDAAKGRRWGYHDDPTDYHRVWRHVRAIFEEEGATNARWVWSPTTWHFTTGDAPAFYPGDDAVDVIGADGYLWSPCEGSVASARDVFGDFLAWAGDRAKPIMLTEWGADADAGAGTKADFVAELAELVADTDAVVAVVVFDAVDPAGRGCDWRIDTSSDALDAYRTLANDPLFGAPASVVATL